MIHAVLLAPLLAAGAARAQGAAACATDAAGAPPAWSEVDPSQRDLLQNYYALATSFSPLHAPVPMEPGHGALAIEASLVPPPACAPGTIDQAPLLVRPRLGFALPELGPAVIYGGVGYVPPIDLVGVRSVLVSGELGVGFRFQRGLQVGARYHFTLLKSVAEVAAPNSSGGRAAQDFFVGSTFGADALVGYRVHAALVPYLAAGVTDASTFLYVGDDGTVVNNMSPYAGFTGAAGVQFEWEWLLAAAEFYTAPGTLYTGRIQLGATL